MRGQPRVLFVTPEAFPLIKSGGLGDVSGALPPALRSLGADVRILLPGYPAVLEGVPLRRVGKPIQHFSGQDPVQLLRGRMPDGETPLFVVDCPALFHRPGTPYQDANGRDWPDNVWRFAALARTALLLSTGQGPLRWTPDIVHCNDWPCGLAPAYMAYAGSKARSLMSVHNLAFSGSFAEEFVSAVGLPLSSYQIEGVEFYQTFSFLKAGLHYADALSTVSPGYAREIQTPDFGGGFHGLLAARQKALTGILNGIDTALWDPATDPHLEKNYGIDTLENKPANTKALRKRLDMSASTETPLLGMVSRLTQQKGVDLLPPMMQELADTPVQLVVLGTGEHGIEENLRKLQDAFPKRVRVIIGYDETLAHQIEAGADLFLMPSRFEPCGLSQMYSMRYGTPPVVRATGGLADSVVDTGPETLRNASATGFCFADASGKSLTKCVRRGLAARKKKKTWRQIQRAGMARDFSWRSSAGAYMDLYRRLLVG